MDRTLYKLLEDENVDRADAIAKYYNATSVLEDLMNADGIDSNEFSKAHRILISRLVAIDPEYGDMFEEILNDDVQQSNMRLEEVLEFDKKRFEYYTTNKVVWDGDFVERVRDENGNILRNEDNTAKTREFDKTFTFRMPGENLDKHNSRMSRLFNDYLSQGDGSVVSMNAAQQVLYYASEVNKDESKRADLPDWIKKSPVHNSFITQYMRFNRVAKHDGFDDKEVLKNNMKLWETSFGDYLKNNPEAGEEFVTSVREERMRQANARKGAAEERSYDEQYQM